MTVTARRRAGQRPVRAASSGRAGFPVDAGSHCVAPAPAALVTVVQTLPCSVVVTAVTRAASGSTGMRWRPRRCRRAPGLVYGGGRQHRGSGPAASRLLEGGDGGLAGPVLQDTSQHGARRVKAARSARCRRCSSLRLKMHCWAGRRPPRP